MEALHTKDLGNINGFDILLKVYPCLDFHKEHFDSEILNEIEPKINTGELLLFDVVISANKAGIELGADILGQCIYKSYESFYTEYRKDYCDYMIETAINEAKQTLQELNS